jgi:peptidylprolyl isomerase
MPTIASRLHLLLVGVALAACSRAPDSTPAPAPGTPGALPPVSGERRSIGSIDYVEVREGSGATVRSGQCAYVHYTGWLPNGRRFETSRDTSGAGFDLPPLPVTLGQKAVIQGWDTGIPGMRVGGIRRLFIPHRFAYGAMGSPPRIPPRTDLVFDIELMAIAETIRSGMKPTCPPWR